MRQDARARALEFADREEDEDARALHHGVVGGGPTGVETRAHRRARQRDHPTGLPRCRPDDVRGSCARPAPEILATFGDLRSLHRPGARTAGSRDAPRRRRVRRRDGRHRSSRATTRSPPRRWSGGRGCSSTRSIHSLGVELERGNRIAVDSRAARCSGIRRCSRSATCMARNGAGLPRLGSVALQSGDPRRSHDQRPAQGQGGKAVQLPRPGQHGDDRRGSAVVQLPRQGCTGTRAQAGLADGAHDAASDRLQGPVRRAMSWSFAVLVTAARSR